MHPFLQIGELRFSLYALMIILGVLVASAVSCLRAHKRGGSAVMVIMIAAIVYGSALIGAKLGYYFTAYEGGIIQAIRDLFTGNFAALMNSGLVFYGGFILALIAACVTIRLAKLDFTLYSEAIVPTIALGHAFGRIGCLLAGCCYGIPYEGPLHVHYPLIEGWDPPPAGGRFPIQPFEAVLNVMLFLALSFYTRKRRPKYHVLFAYMIGYGFIRFFDEFLRGDAERGIHAGLSSSQWISVGVVLFCLFMLLWLPGHRKRENG